MNRIPTASPDALPHYVLWSPNGKMIALIVRSKTEGLTALVYRIGEQGPPMLAHDGFPLFSSWSRNSRFLLFHSGAEHFLVDFEGESKAGRMPGDSRLYMTPLLVSPQRSYGTAQRG